MLRKFGLDGLVCMSDKGKKEGLIQTSKGPLVLLFFDGFDLKARDGIKGCLESKLHFHLRNLKRKLAKQQAHTGFYAAFVGLCESLRSIGCDVRVNDFATARKYPNYPVGVGGFPSVLDHVNLPNPKIFGPGDWGLPDNSDRVVNDQTFMRLIQPSEWFCEVYRPYCGNKIWPWFAGINYAAIPDKSSDKKIYDFVIYDKIRWHRDTEVPRVLDRILRHMEAKGHKYKVLRYGAHPYSEFMQSLSDAKSMLFVCEHETQGLAYQEALAANIPVLTWDEGQIVDPMLQKFVRKDIEVSSVPYFDDRCGMKFKIDDFENICEEFLKQIDNFKPRQFVQECLSLEIAGKRYLEEYEKHIR